MEKKTHPKVDRKKKGYDPDEDYTDYDEDYEKEKKEYADNEKEIFIYGKPGDKDYGKQRTAEELIKYE